MQGARPPPGLPRRASYLDDPNLTGWRPVETALRAVSPRSGLSAMGDNRLLDVDEVRPPPGLLAGASSLMTQF